MRLTLLAAIAASSLMSTAYAQNPVSDVVTSLFATAKPADVLSSNLVGLNIYNQQDEAVGEIKDAIISGGLLSGYIVGVGGFLGIGEKYVIVSPASLRVTYSENDKKWSARMNVTKEQVKSAPEFKYEGRWAR